MSAQSDQIAPAAPDTVTLEVDGRPLRARKGQMLIEVTDAAGIYIPRFCYHGKLSVAANCRMCLVEVEKAPKPLPACATPVAEGMKVWTRSDKARDAQKGTMEFLLINHPLDCPICDQGGECQLQDLSLGYGKDVSRFHEMKRVVKDKDLGPLIATEMTRCIHCTRCVRFGQEIAGLMELGATGRGEHTEIGTYVERSVDSELSGNVIDLCPVGALTSKPFRYSARPWELESRPGVSPHDCVGSNLDVQVRRGRVMRVLPRPNEDVNECWLADRDRFSYQALAAADRLLRPRIKADGRWREVDWRTALEFVAAGLRRVVERHGAPQLGALAAPTATLEEFHLLQKLVRALGSGNVDHRLRAGDFDDDERRAPFPWLGQSLTDLARNRTLLLIGANLRKDQPLVNHRVRQAWRQGAKVLAVNPVDYDFNYDLHARAIVPPAQLAAVLARIARALAEARGQTLPAGVADWGGDAPSSAPELAIAAALAGGEGPKAVLLGNQAVSDSQASILRALAALIAQLSGAQPGELCEANGAAAWLAGCLPQRAAGGRNTDLRGRHAADLLTRPLKGYLLLATEPEFDSAAGAQALKALGAAEFVATFSTFQGAVADYAHAMLPLAAFTETEGTYVNTEGRWQSVAAAVAPPGEARPGWKILRVLANQLGLAGFDYTAAEQVRAEVEAAAPSPVAGAVPERWPAPPTPAEPGLARIYDVPLYAVDGYVRRAEALGRTRDHPPPAAYLCAPQAQALGLVPGVRVRVTSAVGECELELVLDARVPPGAVLIPAGYRETAALGGPGMVRVTGV
jgi:NADH-quinone oxidoreductase subunit G